MNESRSCPASFTTQNSAVVTCGAMTGERKGRLTLRELFLQSGEQVHRFERRQPVQFRVPNRVENGLVNRSERRLLCWSARTSAARARRQLMRERLFPLLMTPEDLPRARNHFTRQPSQARHLNSITLVGAPRLDAPEENNFAPRFLHRHMHVLHSG